MKNHKVNNIWIGQKDLNKESEFIEMAQKETQVASTTDVLSAKMETEDGSSRRDFLKYLGFGLGAATVAAGCDIPVKRAIPYVVKPDAIVPGVATYYASSFVKGGDFCPVLVKTREGRPIKIEGNAMSSMTEGGTSARVQAYVLDLYDVNRVKSPKLNGEKATWDDIKKYVDSSVNASSTIRLISNTILSPTTKKLVGEFLTRFPNAKHIQYDPVSSAALLEASQRSFGQRVVPNYRFDKADYIVSFNADFLGTWISPIEYSKDYAKSRKISNVKNAKMSRHVQVENHMSLTGSNADHRILVKPSEQAAAVAYLYAQIVGQNASSSASLNDKAKNNLKKVAAQLLANRGKSLVVCGNNDINQQILVNAINSNLGNIGATVDFGHASMQRQGDERELNTLINELNSGRVDCLVTMDCNPVYEYSRGSALAEAMAKAKASVALAYRMDETASQCKAIAPVHHGLESWGDAMPKKGVYSLIQPTISPLFNTKQIEECLMLWMGMPMTAEQPYMEYLKKSWSESFAANAGFASGQSFWDNVLRDGIYQTGGVSSADLAEISFVGDASAAMNGIAKPSSSELEISYTEPVSIGNGTYADNPWLQEMPDPVNRTTWGNYLAVPVAFDGIRKFIGMNDLEDGDLVELSIGDKTMTVPVVQQFGQMPGTVTLALGGGRSKGSFAVNNIGVNVNDVLLQDSNGLTQYSNPNISLTRKKGEEQYYSSVQYHNTMGVTAESTESGETINADEAALAPGYGNIFTGFQGALTERSIIHTTNVNHLEESVDHLVHQREHFEELNQHTLYPFKEYSEDKYEQGHHWGMYVDLNACTGCGACTVACMAENNVPVVGKQQVSRHQEMAWLRIDRYYFGDAENPNTVYQPLMCQHCDNAPCENVCPVNATNHSSEGLNQMTYNRCIGTRYCANNCPYKVRRFNWLDYTTADLFPINEKSVNGEETPYGADDLTRMVLNPDVTVRSRGVIEKCSFCVQRIQEGKLTAKAEGRQLRDGDVKSACQTACPTGAIVFGDTNDKNSAVAKGFASPLAYEVLEEVNVRSSVRYSMKVMNRDEEIEA